MLLAASSAVIVLGGIAAELSARGVRQFLVDRPLTTGIVASALTLLVTLFIVDEVVARREAERWALVASTSVASLEQRMPDVRGRILRTATPHVERWQRRRINAFVLGAVKPEAGALEEVIGPAYAADSWRDDALAVLRALVQELRGNAATWAPVMLSRPLLAEHLNRFTSLIQQLEQLGVLVQAKYKHDDWEARVTRGLLETVEATFAFESSSREIHDRADAFVPHTFMRTTPPTA